MGPPPWTALVDEFARRYANHNTARQYRQELGDLFGSTGRSHPRLLTESDVYAWAGDRRLANNTIRNRMSRVATFLRWCVRQGEADPALVETLMGRDNPLRRIPKLYGKVQGAYPARWLSHDEAFGALVGTCDSSDAGRRNELVLRLGLSGVRVAELIALRVGDLDLDGTPPLISWIGKGRRERHVAVGRRLAELLADYLGRYGAALGRLLVGADPLLCREMSGGAAGRLVWGSPIRQTCSVRRIVLRCAADADLGHLSPHDLRRTAAGILHDERGEDGGHRFDLLDIQRVLGHADPATTMRSYLQPRDLATQARAAAVLDG